MCVANILFLFIVGGGRPCKALSALKYSLVIEEYMCGLSRMLILMPFLD